MDEPIFLTVKQVAALLNISERAVRLRIEKSEFTFTIKKEKSRGRSGKNYLIPLSTLPLKVQKKYLAQNENKSEQLLQETQQEATSFEDFSALEREQILFWKKCLEDWERFRNQGGKKTDRDELFVEMWNIQHPEQQLSAPTLRRKYKQWKDVGDIALVDHRGGWNRGKTHIPELAWALFEQLYLHEGKPAIKYVYKLVEVWLKHNMPELLPLPSYETFQRKVKSIPYAVLRLFRYGDKDYEDKAGPYILRKYEELESNEVWVADNHELDIFIKRPNGSYYRPWITMYQDVRSRKLVGWFISDKPNSDTNLYALRKGILRYGIPKVVYTDNGMDFLVTDIAGRGRRKTRKKAEDEHVVPPIFQRMGIEMWNAKVKNARAKIVERAFRDIKDEFSRLCETFAGGNVTERPESLKKTLKDGKNVYEEAEFRKLFDNYCDGWFNCQTHSGRGMYGKTPNEIYAENLNVKRTATEDDLNLMLMRSTGMLKVGRMGVSITLYGEKFWYKHDDLSTLYQGHKVYVRYDPENMSYARVYDTSDKLLLVATNREALAHNATKEDLKRAASEAKRLKKLAKERGEAAEKILVASGIKAPTAMDIMQMEAEYNIANQVDPSAKVIEPVRANEEYANPLPKVSGGDEGVVDMNKMIETVRKFKGGNNGGKP